MRGKVRVGGVVTGQNKRGFDVNGRGGRVGVWRMRGVGGDRALSGQVQETGFRIRVDVQRAGGRKDRRGVVNRPAGGQGGRRRRGRDGVGRGSDGTRAGLQSRVGRGVRKRIGERKRVRRGRPFLLGGGAGITGIRPIG